MSDRKGQRSWEVTPEQFLALPEDGKALMRALVVPYDVQELLVAYRRTGNGAHLWRAWRCLRLVGHPIPDWLLAFIDECAMRLEYSGSTAETAHAIGFLHPDGGDGWGMAHAAAQLAANQGLLRRYETEVGRMKAASNPSRPKSKKAIYELLANEGYGASGDAVKQKILRLTKPK